MSEAQIDKEVQLALKALSVAPVRLVPECADNVQLWALDRLLNAGVAQFRVTYGPGTRVEKSYHITEAGRAALAEASQ